MDLMHPRVHPLTGLPIVPLGYRRSGAPIWPILGASDGTEGDEGGEGGGDGSGGDAGGDAGGSSGGSEDGENGFPENTPVKDMTPEQQLNYWKHHARKHETAFKSKFGADMTPEKLGELQQQIEEQRQQSLSDNEKAIEAAREEGRNAAKAETNATIIQSFIDARIQAAGEGKKAEDFPLLDSIDRSKFVTSSGDIDTDKVATVLDAIIPLSGGSDGDTKTWPFTGQGDRGNSKVSAKDAGRAEAARRFQKN